MGKKYTVITQVGLWRDHHWAIVGEFRWMWWAKFRAWLTVGPYGEARVMIGTGWKLNSDRRTFIGPKGQTWQPYKYDGIEFDKGVHQ